MTGRPFVGATRTGGRTCLELEEVRRGHARGRALLATVVY